MSSEEKFKMFFTKLRDVFANINYDVQEVGKRTECSKFELPENTAILKLIETKDSIDYVKIESHRISQELQEKNSRFFQYHQHVEELVAEMEDKMSAIEDYLSGFGYQKFPGKYSDSPEVSQQESEPQPNKMSDVQTPLKGILKNLAETSGKENRTLYSLKKTPMLVDYGLSSKSMNSSKNKINEQSGVKSVRKKLQFRTPLSSIPDVGNTNGLKYLENEDDPTDIDGFETLEITEEFRVLKNNLYTIKQRTNNTVSVGQMIETVTPENPKISLCRKTDVIPKEMVDGTVTPEEPKLLSCRKKNLNKKRLVESITPEEPEMLFCRKANLNRKILAGNHASDCCPTPSGTYAFYDPPTPETPELISSFKNWPNHPSSKTTKIADTNFHSSTADALSISSNKNL